MPVDRLELSADGRWMDTPHDGNQVLDRSQSMNVIDAAITIAAVVAHHEIEWSAQHAARTVDLIDRNDRTTANGFAAKGQRCRHIGIEANQNGGRCRLCRFWRR